MVCVVDLCVVERRDRGLWVCVLNFMLLGQTRTTNYLREFFGGFP